MIGDGKVKKDLSSQKNYRKMQQIMARYKTTQNRNVKDTSSILLLFEETTEVLSDLEEIIIRDILRISSIMDNQLVKGDTTIERKRV